MRIWKFNLGLLAFLLCAPFALWGQNSGENIVWNITPSDYDVGVQYAIDEAHVVNEVFTIYTTNCHWREQLRVYSFSTHDGFFYSSKLPTAIKSIEFTAGYKVDVLVVYGSNDGTTWTEVAKVEVPATSYTSGLVADFTGTAYNYFKVDVEGANQVRITNMIITLEPYEEVESDYLCYGITSETGKTVELRSFEENFSGGDVVIPTSILYNGSVYQVTSIGPKAFCDCIGLTSISLPKSVVSIGDSAFYNCTNLMSIIIPDSVTNIKKSAFKNCI